MAIQFALDLFPAGFTVCYHFLLYTRHLSRMESGPSITSLRLLLDYVRKICLAASSKLSLLHFLPAEEYTPFCLSVSQSFLTSCLPSHSPYWPLACLSHSPYWPPACLSHSPSLTSCLSVSQSFLTSCLSVLQSFPDLLPVCLTVLLDLLPVSLTVLLDLLPVCLAVFPWPPACLFRSPSWPLAFLSHSPSWPLACLSVSVLLDLLADFLRPFHLPFNVLSFPLPFHFLISCSCSVPPFLAVLSFLFFLHVVVVVCLAFCLLAVLPSCLLLVLSFSHDAFVPFYLQILLDQNFPRFNGSIQKFKFKHKIFHLSV